MKPQSWTSNQLHAQTECQYKRTLRLLFCVPDGRPGLLRGCAQPGRRAVQVALPESGGHKQYTDWCSSIPDGTHPTGPPLIAGVFALHLCTMHLASCARRTAYLSIFHDDCIPHLVYCRVVYHFCEVKALAVLALAAPYSTGRFMCSHLEHIPLHECPELDRQCL